MDEAASVAKRIRKTRAKKPLPPSEGTTLPADLPKAASEAPTPASVAIDRALSTGSTPSGPFGRTVRKQDWAQEQARLDAETEAAIKADFKVFLALVWAHLGLGRPSDVQLSIADYLQHGAPLSVIMAFRGCGKSWITAAFALWTLYCNPQAKVMVVSGNMKRATQFTTFCLALIRDMPLLRHLMPRRDQRQSATSFDVGPATPAQSTSFAAFGITGQLVGQRAELIIADDVETNVNAITVMMREKLVDQVKEFNAILTPGGRIKFLGTPQTNDSIYNKLPGFGYAIRIWPMVYPDDKRPEPNKPSELEVYGDKLSPWIKNRAHGNAGKSVWPERFGDEVVERQRTAWGASGFQLQFMLNTALSDANRYPLKLKNLMVFSLDQTKGPDDLTWGNSDDLVLGGMPLMGFDGDKFYRPASVGTLFSKWNQIVAKIDPSDEGSDECAIAIGTELNGRVFVLAVEGFMHGTSEETLKAIAALMVKWRVGYCRVESNFGGSMFGKLLTPHVVAAWEKWNRANPKQFGGTTIEDERAQKVQKEKRIIADLEPATQSHRLVINQEVIERDFQMVMSRSEGQFNEQYSLFHQFCYLTADRNSLPHDDRLDALAALVAHYRDIIGVNPDQMVAQKEEDAMEAELEALFADADELQGAGQGGDPHSNRHTTGRRSTGWGH